MKHVITRAPLRISFVGGGTDFPGWFIENGGAVISAAIQQYVHVSLRRLPDIFDFKYRIVTSTIQQVNEINDIEQPVVRELLRLFADKNDRFELVYNADLPGKSGLGSSSSFAVACIEAFASFYNNKLNKRELAELAIKVERDILKESGGYQDQIAAAYGGLNQINFSADGFSVEKIPIDDARLTEIEQSLFMVFTKFTRLASEIESKKSTEMSKNIDKYQSLSSQVAAFREVITADSYCFDKVGEILTQNWLKKRALAKGVSNAQLDKIYDEVMFNNASGGKLLGAGSGGFFLFAKSSNQATNLKQMMKSYYIMPVKFDDTGVCTIYRSK